MADTQIAQGNTGRVHVPQDVPGDDPGAEKSWIVRTPGGLIIGDVTEPNAWCVVLEEKPEGAHCRVTVPSYAPPGRNYRVQVEDGRGRSLSLAFDVVTGAHAAKRPVSRTRPTRY